MVTNWRQEFREADGLPETASSADKAARGRRFERILSAMFLEAGFQPRLSYRPKGEEVDGSFWFHGRTILLEAKWTVNPHPASALYQFKGKVDGKILGTLGIFISMSGFSKDAVDALVVGKELNIILADGDDIRTIVDGRISVAEALQLKLRAAGESGTPFYPLSEQSFTSILPRPGRHLVFLEGREDVRYLEAVRTILDDLFPVEFIPAAGPMNMPRLIRLISEIDDSISSITVIVDDDLGDAFLDRLQRDLGPFLSERSIEFEMISIDPDLETALGLADPGLKYNERVHLRGISDESLKNILLSSDLIGRAEKSQNLLSIFKAIGIDLKSHLG